VDESLEVGAVTIPLDRSGAPIDVPIFYEGSRFGLVLAMPELRFVLSPYPNDISMGQGVDFNPGKVYVSGSGQEFLSFRYKSAANPIGSDLLLNINTGSVTSYSEFHDCPVEISRWALVVEVSDRPTTLLTYPATAKPLVFS
jgi:hypothetical protein